MQYCKRAMGDHRQLWNDSMTKVCRGPGLQKGTYAKKMTKASTDSNGTERARDAKSLESRQQVG